MDLLRGNIKTLYFKYLSAAFGSALISSIYGIVDMAMVGQYQGPDGTAALAVVAPVWNVIYSLGLLMGIGGSVIFSTKRGSGMSADGEDEQYFTAAVIGSVILAALAWVGLILFERPLLMFFGTDETLLALAQRYMIPIKVVFPLFLFNQMLAAFLRNDGAPALATLGDGPGHHPRVCDLIPAAAVQHLLDVLFPGHLTAEGGVYRVGRARTRHQRCTDPDAAASCGRGFALVRHAHHGACHRRLRCGVHPQIHRAARRKSRLTKRGHRRIIMSEF